MFGFQTERRRRGHPTSTTGDGDRSRTGGGYGGHQGRTGSETLGAGATRRQQILLRQNRRPEWKVERPATRATAKMRASARVAAAPKWRSSPSPTRRPSRERPPRRRRGRDIQRYANHANTSRYSGAMPRTAGSANGPTSPWRPCTASSASLTNSIRPTSTPTPHRGKALTAPAARDCVYTTGARMRNGPVSSSHTTKG